MPKRFPTPPPGDDEPRYFTVVHPYPLHARMEFENDRIAFVYWIASCIGKENLFAFFHKPKSPNMIIIEVNRDFQDYRRLLGEHRWGELLLKPSAEEKRRSSKIYFCTYNTGREVEKKGWKRVFIEDHWFNAGNTPKWLPVNQITVDPYPKTIRCEVPSEDKTRETFCRPLPVKLFPPLPATRPPAAGSEDWATAKEAALTPVASGAWAEGAPHTKPIEVAGKSAGTTEISAGVSNMGAWARGPARAASMSSVLLIPAGLAVPSASTSSSGHGSPDLSGGPPGLERNPPSSTSSSSFDERGDFCLARVPHNDNVGIADAMQSLSMDDDLYTPPDELVAPGVPALMVQEEKEGSVREEQHGYEQRETKDAQEGSNPVLREEGSQGSCPQHGEKLRPAICQVCHSLKKAKAKADKDTSDNQGNGRAKGGLRTKSSAFAEAFGRNKGGKGRGVATGANNIALSTKPARFVSRPESKSPNGDTAPPAQSLSPVPAPVQDDDPADESNVNRSRTPRAKNTIPTRPARLRKNADPGANRVAASMQSGSGSGNPSPSPSTSNTVPLRPARLGGNVAAPPAALNEARSDGGSITSPAGQRRNPWDNIVSRAASKKRDDDRDDAKSVSASSVRSWGAVSAGQWSGGNVGQTKISASTWAEQMDEEDARSDAETWG